MMFSTVMRKSVNTINNITFLCVFFQLSEEQSLGAKKNYIEPFTHLTTAGLANDTGRGRKESEVFYTAHDSRLGEVQMHKELRCQPFGPPGKKRKENVRILDLLEFPLSHLSRNAHS